MAGSTKQTRTRAPLMSAFRAAFEGHDARRRVDDRDENGERVIAGRRSAGRSAVSEQTLQRAVSEDIETLMNTTNLESRFDFGSCDEARRSILNYGLPDSVHHTANEVSVQRVGVEIAAALAVFEPRLVPGSVRVERDKSFKIEDLKLRYVVRADLNCDPLDVPVEFFADVEKATGKVSLLAQ